MSITSTSIQSHVSFLSPANSNSKHIGSLFLTGKEPNKLTISSTSNLVNYNEDVHKKINPTVKILKKTSMGVGLAPLCALKEDFYDSDVLEDAEHSHAVPWDIDEIIHALYAAVKGNSLYEVEAFEDNSLIPNEAIKHLGEEVGIHGDAMALIAVIPISIVILPFSYKAVKAGLGELAHAKEKISSIKRQQSINQINTELMEDILKKVSEKINEVNNPQDKKIFYCLYTLLNTNKSLIQQQMQQQTQNLKLAKLDKCIARSSILSGSIISSKVVLDLIMKLSSLACTNPIFNTSLSVFGMINTMVLAPLAGVFATSLGVSASMKTAKQIKLLKEKIKGVQERFKKVDSIINNNNDKKIIQDSLKNYVNFQNKKAKFRQNFFNKYFIFNVIFTLGSAFYALSSTTQAVLIGCAIAGVATAPIPFGVLIGIFGGIMGVGSLAFLLGHPKQHEYDDQQEKLSSDALIKFYAIIENLPENSLSETDESLIEYEKLKTLALKDRALKFNSLKNMFDEVENLNTKIAKNHLNLKYKSTKFSEDKIPSLMGSFKNTGQKILGGLSRITLQKAYKVTHWKASAEIATEFSSNTHHKIFKTKYITKQQLAQQLKDNVESKEISKIVKKYLLHEQEIIHNKQAILNSAQKSMPFIQITNEENRNLILDIENDINYYNKSQNLNVAKLFSPLNLENIQTNIQTKIETYNKNNSHIKLEILENGYLTINTSIVFNMQYNEIPLITDSISNFIGELNITDKEEKLYNLNLQSLGEEETLNTFIEWKNLNSINNNSTASLPEEQQQKISSKHIIAQYFAGNIKEYSLKNEYKERRNYWFNVELFLSKPKSSNNIT